MRYCLLLLLGFCVPALAQAQRIDVPVDKGWRATPEWCPFEKAATYDGTFQEGFARFRASGGGRTMIWTCNPSPRLNVAAMRYVSLRYRLANTNPALPSYALYLDTGSSGGMQGRNLIFSANDLIHDGRWHTATTTLSPFGEIGAMALRIGALEGKEGRLDVRYLRFSAEPPRSPIGEALDWHAGEPALAAEPVSLDALRQEELPALQEALDLSDWFTTEKVVANGVSFRVPPVGRVSQATSTPGKERLRVPVGRSTGALYLLLGARFPYKMLAYDGWAPGDMTDRPEQFRVVVRYADGSEEEEVPFCLSSGRHGVWRGLHAYALPVDARKQVREIEVCDGMVTSSFHLVAVSAGAKSLAPTQSEAAARTPAGRPPASVRPALLVRGDRLLARNRAGELEFDLAGGLALVGARNAAHPDWRLRVRRVPLFSVKEQQTVWDAGEFRPGAPVTIRGPRARVTMTCEKARVAVDLKIEALADEVAFVPRVRNLAPEPRALDVTFPRVSLHAPAGRAGDLWYFYPSMCPVWANQDRALDTAHSGYFPLQFQDVYDRARGGGLSLGTRSRSLRQRYFQLAKADGAATLGVEYRFNPPLPPGEWVEYPKAFVALHGGDWRPALESYQRWLASWCRPQRPRLEWYQRVWNFRTYWTHTLADGNPEFCFLDPKSGEYQPDKFVTKDRGIFGQVDMAHFFDWRISREFGTWGDYSHYEDIGGLEKFRGMIRRLQAQGVRVGLYLDAYLCSRKSLVGKEHGEAWALRRQDGRLGDAYSTPGDAMLNMCVLHPGWQDFLAQTCGRVARETGCDGIYLDEGMTDYGAYWCWSKEHGHPVPGTNQAGLLDLSRKVRAALPDQVAFYTEWAPPDVLIPHLDGAYQASLRFSDPQLSPGFLQIHRFVFSDFRVFPISNGGSMFDGIWEGTKYSLFSGVPLYSLAWGHDAECLPFYRRMSAVLHAHGEAFRTRTPQPYVQTERADVFCNAFPGAKETVWTLFNGRFRTVTGPILRVKHVPGARYRDVWNDKDLKPAIERGMAVLALPIGPRGVGVVAQRREGKK